MQIQTSFLRGKQVDAFVFSINLDGTYFVALGTLVVSDGESLTFKIVALLRAPSILVSILKVFFLLFPCLIILIELNLNFRFVTIAATHSCFARLTIVIDILRRVWVTRFLVMRTWKPLNLSRLETASLASIQPQCAFLQGLYSGSSYDFAEKHCSGGFVLSDMF